MVYEEVRIGLYDGANPPTFLPNNNASSLAIRKVGGPNSPGDDWVYSSQDDLFGDHNGEGLTTDLWTAVTPLATSQIRSPDFCVAVKIKNLGANTANIAIDTIQVRVYWKKSFQAVMRHNYTSGTNRVPYMFMADAIKSQAGDHLYENCEARWSVAYQPLDDTPDTWEMKTFDPRPGMEEAERDCATDAVAYVMGWVFDKPGAYTVTLAWIAPNGTTSTTTQTVNVTADNRTRYYVDYVNGHDTSNNGLSWGTAWKTLKRALVSKPGGSPPTTRVPDHSTVMLKGGITHIVAEQIVAKDYSDIVVRGESSTNRPTIAIDSGVAANDQALYFGDSHRVVVHFINFVPNYATTPVHGAIGSAFYGNPSSNMCIYRCDASGLVTFINAGDGGNRRNLLVYNCNAPGAAGSNGITNQLLYGGYWTNIVVVGCRSTHYLNDDGNGHFRFKSPDGPSDLEHASGCSVLWCDAQSRDDSQKASYRMHSSYSTLYQCSAFYAVWFCFSIGPGDGHVSSTIVFRCDGVYSLSTPVEFICSHARVQNCVMEARPEPPTVECVTVAGNTEQLQIVFCTLRSPLFSGSNSIVSLGSLRQRENQIRLIGNAIINDEDVPEDDLPRYLTDGSNVFSDGAQPLFRSKQCVWPASNTEHERFTLLLGTPKHLALDYPGSGTLLKWVAQSPIVDGDDGGGAHYSNLTATFRVPITSPYDDTAAPLAGVFRDYRGIARDFTPTSGFWLVGATGDEV